MIRRILSWLRTPAPLSLPAVFGESFHESPPGGWDGWHHWMSDPPPLDAKQVLGWRKEWPVSQLMEEPHAKWRDAMNVYGLYWKEPSFSQPLLH